MYTAVQGTEDEDGSSWNSEETQILDPEGTLICVVTDMGGAMALLSHLNK